MDRCATRIGYMKKTSLDVWLKKPESEEPPAGSRHLD